MKKLERRMKLGINLGMMLVLVAGLMLSGCTKEEIESRKNDVAFQATDAPIDNAEVKAVFVTIAGLNVDGNEVEGFQKTTIELSALTEGKTQLLKNAQIDASSINTIDVILDYDQDAQGNSPGSYVLKVDGTKEAISSSSSKLTVQKMVNLNAQSSTNVVLDFDLRKMIVEKSEGDFELASKGELESFIRVVNESETGTLKGEIDNASMIDAKAVAYLYKKGAYAESEMQAQGESNVTFANAVNSAEVNEQGEFVLAFTEDGEYEIHVFEYKDTDNDGDVELTGRVQLTSSGNINLDGFKVDAQSTVNLDLGITAVLPL